MLWSRAYSLQAVRKTYFSRSVSIKIIAKRLNTPHIAKAALNGTSVPSADKPITMDAAAPAPYCAKPISEDARPAMCANGDMAPAVAAGIKRAKPTMNPNDGKTIPAGELHPSSTTPIAAMPDIRQITLPLMIKRLPPTLSAHRPASQDAVKLPTMTAAKRRPNVSGLTPINSISTEERLVKMANRPAKGPIPTKA